MPKPITPFVGADTFICNENNEVLLVKRIKSGRWAMPGGFQDYGETPKECAIRETKEETGYTITITRLLGVYSSRPYPYIYYQYKDEELTHIFFEGTIQEGTPTPSDETTAVEWFSEHSLPPLFDGHETRIKNGFKAQKDKNFRAHFE